MNILIVDSTSTVVPAAEAVFRAKGWRPTVVRDLGRALTEVLRDVPDAIVVHGDGPNGSAAHLCQQFKQNGLTSGVPLILVEDAPPPAWLLAGMPADAVVQAPWEPIELVHQMEMLAPNPGGSGLLDDLTNFPRRRSILDEISRRMVARELFAVGLLALRETDAYRQDYGRMGLDQFVVLVSVLLRRHNTASSPISIGYLDEGSFVIVGAPSTVHQIVAQTVRDFDGLVPAYYEMDTLFGPAEDHEVGPPTWIGLHGAVWLIEPEKFDNILQVGFLLADTLATSHDALVQAGSTPEPATGNLAAD